MGMYDNINFKANCKSCEKPLSSFQSKDGPCALETLNPGEVKSFYSPCDHCKAWNDFKVICETFSIHQTCQKNI